MRCCAFLFLLAATLHAQTPAPPPPAPASTLSVNANLVILPTIVRDKKGELVNNLTVNDFVLKVSSGRNLDNAKPAVIKYFDHDDNTPLTLGLLVDVSRSQREVLPEEKSASQSFLNKSLKPADKAFIVQFAKPIELLQDVTAESARLQKAVGLLGTEGPSFHTTDAGDTRDEEGRTVHNGGTSLYDSIYLSANEVTAKQTGRKALIVLTDGVDVGSKESLTDALEAAQRADTVIYAIYFRSKDNRNFNNNYPGNNRRSGGYPGGGYPGGGYPGGGYPGGGYPGGGYPGGNNPNNPNDPNNPNGRGPSSPTRKPSIDGHQVLERLCGETGGAVFEVSKHDTIDDIFTKISAELRAQYRLGFTPTAETAREGYHQIDLELTGENAKKKFDIQVRSGYYVGAS